MKSHPAHTMPASNPLDASPNQNHLSYKLLGLLSWAVLAFCLISLILTPPLLLNVARLVAIYMMVRFILFTVFYLAGLLKIRSAEKQAARGPLRGLSSDEIARFQALHHLVVLPNYKEPVEVLRRTIASLAVQPQASTHITLVLGMEAREPGALGKAEALRSEFEGVFHSMLLTVHPSDLPGELPGKATNETWAVRQARLRLVDHLGIPASQVVVTVVDADSLLHPHYLIELTRQFVLDPRRFSLVWQAPVLLDNDIWRTQAVIRLLTFFSNAISLGDYFNPLEANFPYSTYSLSLQLLDEGHYWDPTAIAEDQDLFLHLFFAKGGNASIRHIYLPVHGNPVYGASFRDAVGIFYSQKLRQGLGGAEIGYILQKWASPPGTPFLPKFIRFFKLLHDHLFFSTAGFLVTLGTILSIILDHTAVITLPPHNFAPLLFTILNSLGGSTLLVVWFTERLRLSRGRADWSLKTLLGEVLAWVIFPVLFFLLMNLPGLLSQTQMLLGRPIPYYRTPKGFNSKLGE
jgi:cellulose synthase/poly-beta-1,6-N-acetylglucosamine synthase-like glycosyltransferase